jgi:hypothetical protein
MRKALFFSIAAHLVLCGVVPEAMAGVSGRVLTVNLAPVAGATISAYRRETSEETRRRLLSAHPEPSPTATATTDADGRFTIDVQVPTARLLVQSPAGAAAELEARRDDDLGTILLPIAPPSSVVVTAAGRPVANAAVAMGSFVTHSDAKGMVVIPAISSSEVLVIHPDYSILRAVTGPGQKDLPHSFELTAGVVVDGTVMEDSIRTPVKGAVVWMDGWPLGTSGDDGKFSIRHAPPNWTYAFVRSGRSGDVVLRDVPGSSAVRLSPGQTFSGQLVDEKDAPVPGVIFILWGPEARTTVTDARGSFSFSVAPGMYRGSIDHPGYVGEYEVNLLRQEDSSMVFTAFAASTVTGRVVDEEHKPVAGAMVWSGYPYSPGAGGVSVALSAGDGTFTLRRTSAKFTSSVVALKKGYVVSTARNIVIKPGQPLAGVTVTLHRGFESAIEVVDTKGLAVRYSTVTLERWEDETGTRKEELRCPDEDPTSCFDTASDGKVTLRIVPGKYDVLVAGDDLKSKHLVGVPLAPGGAPLRIVVERVIVPVIPGVRPAARFESTAGRVEGKVLDKQTLRPVADFNASLAFTVPPAFMPRSANGSAQEQNHDGRFAFENVSPGNVDLLVTAPGYLPERRRGVKIDAGRTTGEITIELVRGATVSGSITDPHHVPLSGVKVSLEEFGGSDRPPAVTTDSAGHFVLAGLTLGPKILLIAGDGYAHARKKVSVDGAETRIDVELAPGRDLPGRVVDDAGLPVAGAHVQADGRSTWSEARSDVNGAFRLDGVGPETFTMIATKTGYMNATLTGIEGTSARDLSIVLKRGGSIAGHISGLTAVDAGRISVTAQGATAFTGPVDAAGNFLVQGLPDGALSVYAQGPGRQTEVRSVTVTNGGAAPVELELITGAALHGRITRGGNPLARTTVHISGTNGLSREVLTGPDGTYVMHDLPPGEYSVFLTPDSGAAAGAQGVRVVVTASGAVYDRDFKDATIRGRVLDAARQPIREAAVSFTGAGGAHVVSTDADGRFVFEHVMDATITVAGRKSGYAPEAKRISITSGSAADVELTLVAVGATLVRVVDARTDSVLDAVVVAGGSMPSPVGSSSGSRTADGTQQLWLQPGDYELTVMSGGHVQQSVKISVPGPPLEVRLERAGSVNVSYDGPGSPRVDLMDTGGKRVGGARLVAGRTSSILSLAEGAYVLLVLGADGKTAQSYPVQVVEGQAASVSVH